MDLFSPVVNPDRFHPHFANALIPTKKAERDLLQSWAEGFVDRDGKLVEEFQTTFNSSFWEIYLHGAFKEYGFAIDLRHATPDFLLSAGGVEIVVEATTANAAQGKPNEWDRFFSLEELTQLKFKPMNTEAIIRLSNAILGKVRKYDKTYKSLPHVRGRPFVLAVAPFEQPHFNFQYDRPIRALLYDYYVDEDAYLENPEKYPNGHPPTVHLGYVEKDNGAEIPLGFFNAPGMSEVSAVAFSCLATWGKVSAMSGNEEAEGIVSSMWASPPTGKPVRRVGSWHEHVEVVRDGLQIFHNPFARYPVPPEFFRAPRVIQHYRDPDTGEWHYEGITSALLSRSVQAFHPVQATSHDWDGQRSW